MKYEHYIPSLSHEVQDFFDTLSVHANYSAKTCDWVRTGDTLGEISVNPARLQAKGFWNAVFPKDVSASEIEFKIVSPITGRVGYSGANPIWSRHRWAKEPRAAPTRIEDIASFGYGSSLVTASETEIFPAQVYGELLSYFITNKSHWDAASQKSEYYTREWYEYLCKEAEFFEAIKCPSFSEEERRTYRPLTKEHQEFLDRIFR